MSQFEKLSRLLDEDLDASELDTLLNQDSKDLLSTWGTYHLIGDVLRSQALAEHHKPGLLASIASQLEAEPTVVAPVLRVRKASSDGWLSKHLTAARGLRLVGAAAAVTLFSFALNTAVPPLDSDIRMVRAKVQTVPVVSDEELALWQEYFSAHQQNALRSGLAGVSPMARIESDSPTVAELSNSSPSRQDGVQWMNVWSPESELSGLPQTVGVR